MNSLKKILLVALALASHFTGTFAVNTIPNVVIISSSGSVGGMPVNNIINGSGLSDFSVAGLHDNNENGSTMWTCNYQWSDISVVFDLVKTYHVADLYIWNFNQPGYLNKGMKNVKIQYSLNNVDWTNVAPPQQAGYVPVADYPFQLAQGTGSNNMPSSNLNDGNHTPVSINADARYIRIIAPQIGSAAEGNWGGPATGLSEVLFTTTDNVGGYEVDIDAQKTINTCGNLVFGGCGLPSYAQAATILPMFSDAGLNTVRLDFFIESIVPSLSSVEDYYNNVNDCQNPDKWNYTNMELLVLAKKAGMKTMAIISYCPEWLSYNGKTNGVPKDMTVYTDILRKIYSRYHQYVDYVEFYNEPGYFFNIEKSPYTSVGKALADMYVPCYEVVQSISPGKPMGGLSVVTWSDGGVGGTTNTDFFTDPRINHSNFNFYSHHVYSDYGIETSKETVTRVKSELSKFGFGDLPVWFTEWSSSISNAADTVTYIGTKSHTFVGKCLINWMRDGLAGAHHWNFLQAVTINGTEAGASIDAHGMYAWNAATKTGYLLPKAYVYKLLSRSLGLGEGENKVLDVNNTADAYLNIAAFTNAAGSSSVVIVNEQTESVRITLKISGLASLSALDEYMVTFAQKGETPENVSFTTADGSYVVTLSIPASSVVGIKCLK